MYNTAIEILETYPLRAKMAYASDWVEQGYIEAMVVENGNGWDVWNMHPLRKSWQHVYSLDSCVRSEHVAQSIQSLKRLFDKE